MKNAHDVEKHT